MPPPNPTTVSISENYAFGVINSLAEAFEYLIMPGFMIAGIAVVFYFLFGAFKFLTSGGNKDSIESARKMITHAIIGFILLMLMFLILQYLPQALGLKQFRIIT